jgi:hypothetical protein
MKIFLLVCAAILLQINAFSQKNFTISGTVKNDKGEKIQSATIFIAGSEKITMSDANGYFSFKNIIAGNHVLVVNMLGYNSVKQNVIVKDGPETVDLVLADKVIVLNEVVVGTKKQSKDDLKIFIKYFMGDAYNSEKIKIINPEIIDFVKTDTMLTATTSDFLIIENTLLGYRIKYLLKRFFYHYKLKSSYYDGDFVFEQLAGNNEMQSYWARYRKWAYQGSLMHFYRSVYAGTSRSEGFLLYKNLPGESTHKAERSPTDVEQFVKRPDSNYVTFKILPWAYVVYNKEKAGQPDKIESKKTQSLWIMSARSTIFSINAKVEGKGSIYDISDLRYQGFWGRRRVMFQLPYEYTPEQ